MSTYDTAPSTQECSDGFNVCDIAIVPNPLMVSPETPVSDVVAQMNNVNFCSRLGDVTDRESCRQSAQILPQQINPQQINPQQINPQQKRYLDELHWEIRASCVIVLEDQQVVGLLTQSELLRGNLQQVEPNPLIVRQVMVAPVLTLQESDCHDLFVVEQFCWQHRVRHLPILDGDDRVIGLITAESLSQALRFYPLTDQSDQCKRHPDICDRERTTDIFQQIPPQQIPPQQIPPRQIPPQQSDILFRVLFEQSVVGIAFSRLDTEIPLPMRINQKLCDMLGYSEAELLSMTFMDIVYPEDLARSCNAIADLKSGRQSSYTLEARYVRKEGQVFWAKTSVSRLTGVPQYPDLKVVMLEDISDRKRTEVQLQETQQRLTLATTSAHIGVWELDLVEHHLVWDERMYQLYGVEPSQLGDAYETWQQQVHPDDLAITCAEVQAAIAAGRDFHTEFRVLWPQGQIRHLEAHGRVLRNAAGVAQRMIGINWDITDRKQAEVQLQKLVIGTAATTGQQFFSALVQHIAEALNICYVSISEYVGENKLHVLGSWANGVLQPPYSHDPTNTPCGRTLEAGTFYCERSLQDQFPKNLELVNIKAESFLGTALYNAEGQVIGCLCLLDQHPIENPKRAKQLLQVFAARAAAELERQRANALLEATIQQRTQELLQLNSLRHALLDSASYAIVSTNPIGIIQGFNAAAEQMLGYTAEEVVGKVTPEIFHDRQEMLDRAALLTEKLKQEIAPSFETFVVQARQGLVTVDEWTYIRKDGTRFPALLSVTALQDDHHQIVGFLGIVQDITQRRQAEQERQQVLQELSDFKFALDQSAIAATTNAKGVITSVNDRFCEISGYSREELIGQTHRIVNSGYHPPGFFKEMWRTIAKGQIWRGEICNRTKDGKLYWLDSTFVPFLDATGRPFQYLAVRFEVTERKQAEQVVQQQAGQEKLLRQTTERIRQSLDLKTIFNTACEEICSVLQVDRVGIFKFDVDSGYNQGEFVAESRVTQFGSVLGVPVRDHCFGEKYANLYIHGRFLVADDIYQKGLTPCHSEILAQFKVRACIVIPLLCGNQLWGLLAFHHCATSRHWTTSEINLAQQLANQLAIAIQQANLVEQLQQELIQRHLTQQQLTKRNQELAITNAELARATRLKDEFLANMSHELRTPLNAILGMTEGLSEGIFGPLNTRQTDAIETIEHSSSHLLELINDILDVAKIEAGHMEMEFKPTSVTNLCESSLAFIKQQALKKRIHLELKLPKTLPDLFVDERRIRQVLINLLSNAVKFTPEAGEITLRVSRQWITPYDLQGITWMKSYRPPSKNNFYPLPPHDLPESEREVHDMANRDYLRIAVIDTGIGIAPEQVDKLFHPFVQIDTALNRQYTGTGLGLTLVKRIVELHHGEVELTSREGVGSCFTIGLPCVSLETPAAKPDTTASAHAQSTQAEMVHHVVNTDPLILLAEDNEANIRTISSYLKARGYRLLVTQNGQEAIVLTQSQQPDLILMDIQMPGMDGLEAIHTIRSTRTQAQIPIIALTALATTHDREQCLAAGANDYFSKPIKLKQLVTAIQHLLAAQENHS